MDTDILSWTKYEDRIVASTERVLSVLGDIKATFFVLGYVAEHYPELVKLISTSGHEIGTHGYSHKQIHKLTPEQFKSELLKSIEIIKSITGKEVYSHRASNFTVMEKTAWSVDIMTECGIIYDSSVFPVKTPLYGLPHAPLYPYNISTEYLYGGSNKGIYEFPLSVLHLPFKNIPIAGGFYLRFFPYEFIKKAIKTINRKGKSAVIYIHPWEIDVNQPKIKDLKWFHYYNISKTEAKFKLLLNDFEFTSISGWLRD
ncbi:MAG TPA: polysaccharide deacetylase family protein [Methanosarcina sp.]